MEMGIGPEELLFQTEPGKDPIINPLLTALVYEFIQFEEFVPPPQEEGGPEVCSGEVSDRLKLYESKCDMAVSRVMSSPWASISSIRGRMISSVIIEEEIKEFLSKVGYKVEVTNVNGGVYRVWTHSIHGGFHSSQEKFNPVKSACSAFSNWIQGNFKVGEISIRVTPVNDIPDREVGWKIHVV